MKIIQCPSCNKEISNLSVKCPHCGSLVTGTSERKYEPLARKSRWLANLIWLLLLLALAGGAYYYYSK